MGTETSHHEPTAGEIGAPRSAAAASRRVSTTEQPKPSLLVIGRDERAGAGTFEFLEDGFELAVADGRVSGLARAFLRTSTSSSS